MRTDGLLEGRYRLDTRLGRGGAADVYAADDVRLERRVAVKLFRPVDDEVGLRRFLAEAELLASLSHPSLLTVFDVCLDGDRPYLVLQLAAGGTLRQRINEGPLAGLHEVAALGAELADVLAHVHAHGIVHRDVKPANVLFDRDGGCYLADFGIARALGAAHLTRTGEFIGTAAYLAPEQVVDRDTGPEVDVYALGLVLLECLTGHPEYTGTDVEVAVARLSRQPRLPDRLTPPWRAVLSAMTAFDPADRPDARRCAESLRALASTTVPTPMPLAVPGPRRAPRAVAGLAALAVATTAGVLLASGPTATVGRPVSDPASVVRSTTPPAAPVSPATAENTITAVAEVPPGDDRRGQNGGGDDDGDNDDDDDDDDSKSGKNKNGESGKG